MMPAASIRIPGPPAVQFAIRRPTHERAGQLAPVTQSIILVVDDHKANRDLLDAQLEGSGHIVLHAADGLEALDLMAQKEPDLLLLDIQMPRMDGLTLCRRIKAHPAWRLIPVVLITALMDRTSRLAGVEAGADDFLTKPFDKQELGLRIRVLLHDREQNKRLDATEGVLLALARVVEARDRYTIHHAERVGLFAREIGRAAGMADVDLNILYLGGVMHDLGKVTIPDAILNKPGALTEQEMEIMRTHSEAGEGICTPLRSAGHFLPMIRHHHERLDGGGYPDHLVGSAIPLAARIAAIGDAWDAMTSDRPYRAGLGVEEARSRLRAGAGTQWDAQHVEHFLQLLDGGVDEWVRVAQQLVPTHSGVAASPNRDR